MTGVPFLVRVLAQCQRRRLIVWVLALVGSLAFTAIAVARLYDTPAAIQSYGEAVVSDALVAINGRVEGIDSLGGIIADEFGFLASFLMPLAGIAWVASMTRAEEASGRLEALLSGRVDRRAPVVAALTLVALVVAVMSIGFTASLLVAAIDVGPAVLYALSLGMVVLVFAALSAVLAQVMAHSRGVYAGGFVVLGLSYLARGLGDVHDSFWVWLSPLGWMEKTAAFADNQRWWVLLVPLAVSMGLTLLAVALAARRDLGAAWIRQGAGPGTASGLLARSVGLALHTQLRSFLGWVTGSLALAGVMGALAPEFVEAVVGNASLSQATGITSQDASNEFLAFTQVYLAILTCGFVVQALGTLRRQETQGQLEPMLVGSSGRSRWLGAQLVVILTCLVLLVVASAVILSAAIAWSTGGGGEFATVLRTGLAYVPAVLVVAGVAALLFGAAPRAFALAWATFGAVTFIGLLGSGLQLPQWLLDLSPLTHVGSPPVSDAAAGTLAGLAALSLALVCAAFAGFRVRRIPQG